MEINDHIPNENEAAQWLFGPDTMELGFKARELVDVHAVTNPTTPATMGISVVALNTEKMEEPGPSGGTINNPGEKYGFGEMYYRVRAAREKEHEAKRIEISDSTITGQDVAVKSSEMKTSFEDNPDILKKCFFGSRITDKGQTVNQTA